MFRWMVSRPALFVAGVTAGIWSSHHFSASQPGVEAEPVVATATEAASPKVSEAPRRFEPLSETDDDVVRLPIQRTSGVSVAVSDAEQDRNRYRDQNKVVTVEPVSAGVPRAGRAHLAAKTDPIANRVLARNIQRELVRVGCRSVSISGRWDSRSVQASAKFLSNRNALLPSDRADVVLLSMLRGYQGGQCGLAEREGSARAQAAAGSTRPVTIRSASLPPGGSYASAIRGGAATGQNLDTPAGPSLGDAEAVPKPRPTSSQSTRRGSSSKRRVRVQKQNWRRKFFGNGLDG